MRCMALLMGVALAALGACGGDGEDQADGSSAGTPASGGTGATGGTRGSSGGSGATEAAHDFCADVGDRFGMGAAIFGDVGTEWYGQAAEAPSSVDWTYGYLYATVDPEEDLEGFTWLVNYRLDTAEEGGASIPTVTFYRMLTVGREHGYGGSEAETVQAMLTDAEAVSDYLDNFIAVLEILDARSTPTLVQVEPDSWGFMMWAFDGVDESEGNPDASAIPVSLAAANHPALAGQTFADDAGGLGQAMLYLRDTYAPSARMGWHASNFRAGTHPEVVTSFYSSVGAWDVIVTEPPHMNSNGSEAWDESATANQNNLAWLATVSSGTGLPILIWQTYVEDAAPYLGGWPQNRSNLTALAENGVVGVLWDPNGVTGECNYTCAQANALLDSLSAYSADPLTFPAGNPCAN